MMNAKKGLCRKISLLLMGSQRIFLPSTLRGLLHSRSSKVLRCSACGPQPCPRGRARKPCRREHPWQRRHCDGCVSSCRIICRIYIRRECLPSANGGVAVLGDLLVGLLGSTAGDLLDLVIDEVAGLLERIHCDRFGLFGWCLKRSG
jgi:hypothetical protein